MDKDKKFSKKILVKIGVALLIIAPLILGVWYTRHLVESTTDTIVESRKQFTKKASSLNALVNLRDQYQNFGKAYLNVLHNVIPIKDELINISKELESLAVKNNLDFGFSFQGEKKASNQDLGYVKYSLNIKGGDIPQIQDFIKDLNNFKYINTIDSIDIKRTGKNKEEKIKSDIGGRVYFRKINIQ